MKRRSLLAAAAAAPVAATIPAPTSQVAEFVVYDEFAAIPGSLLEACMERQDPYADALIAILNETSDVLERAHWQHEPAAES